MYSYKPNDLSIQSSTYIFPGHNNNSQVICQSCSYCPSTQSIFCHVEYIAPTFLLLVVKSRLKSRWPIGGFCNAKKNIESPAQVHFARRRIYEVASFVSFNNANIIIAPYAVKSESNKSNDLSFRSKGGEDISVHTGHYYSRISSKSKSTRARQQAVPTLKISRTTCWS